MIQKENDQLYWKIETLENEGSELKWYDIKELEVLILNLQEENMTLVTEKEEVREWIEDKKNYETKVVELDKALRAKSKQYINLLKRDRGHLYG